MKNGMSGKFLSYLSGNLAGNFAGFVIGMASTRLVAHFFTTRSIHNLWGLTARKTVVDKQSFHALEWCISTLIGFLVFEVVSKFLKQKLDDLLPRYKATRWLVETQEAPAKN
ncbi:hypothetical protein [Flavihumibacter petaseus]|uniref:Uncharacterized protein n=1 Tax=Flavihumibacter petaseus NBRC 106054 TaxID=1220578 RepID=A0A0E9N808_9BACT|nr:hypothetical protein [Flavihumibacter petaseus]GAO45505.1 hypothetical protein FPE01S_05_02000 [Flavihumibacter petaseus NBRC 106054]